MRLGSSKIQHQILNQILIAVEPKAGSALVTTINRLMVNRITQSDINHLYVMLERSGANRELLGAIGSWGDTLSSEAVLEIVGLRSLKV